ncbi:hypothetical protein D9611_008634 [Ephemerocybe angulata]|uniref:Uncharacterized protein n=1 Tax=Ephemerocybe angulata TaxID=980116 RepID=A0A8H5AZZ6_9AGAR|nr:hypothetical protein D9611_008634 [Tulosesus angulatus]
MADTLQSAQGSADFADARFRLDVGPPQQVYDVLIGTTHVPEVRNKMESIETDMEALVTHVEGSPYYLGHPHLGAKLAKLQGVIAIGAKLIGPGDRPLVDPRLRDRLSELVTKSRRIKDGKMFPGDLDPPASRYVGYRGTKRTYGPPAQDTPNKTRVVTQALGASQGAPATTDWRARGTGGTPPSASEVLRRGRDFLSREGQSDGPEARLVAALTAYRGQLFSLESQMDVVQAIWTEVGKQHDAKVLELHAQLGESDPPMRVSYSSRPAETRALGEPEAVTSRVTVDLRVSSSSAPRALRETRARAAAAASVRAEAAKVEASLGSGSRDKGKQRAVEPERASTRSNQRSWADEVAEEDTRMAVSDGEDQVAYESESDESDAPRKGYHSS